MLRETDIDRAWQAHTKREICKYLGIELADSGYLDSIDWIEFYKDRPYLFPTFVGENKRYNNAHDYHERVMINVHKLSCLRTWRLIGVKRAWFVVSHTDRISWIDVAEIRRELFDDAVARVRRTGNPRLAFADEPNTQEWAVFIPHGMFHGLPYSEPPPAFGRSDSAPPRQTRRGSEILDPGVQDDPRFWRL